MQNDFVLISRFCNSKTISVYPSSFFILEMQVTINIQQKRLPGAAHRAIHFIHLAIALFAKQAAQYITQTAAFIIAGILIVIPQTKLA